MIENTGTPLTTDAPPVRDLELESALIGPTTRMIQLEADDEGRVIFQFGKRRHHTITLPRSFARAPLLVLDSTRWTLLLEPRSKRLEAMHFTIGTTGRTILLGTNWGKWIDERGAVMSAVSVPELIQQWNSPVVLYETRQSVAIEFQVNIYNRDIFTPNALLGFREGPLRHSIELQFSYPLGGFRLARIKMEDEVTHRVDSFMDLVGFPLIPQDPKKVHEPARPAGANGGSAPAMAKTAAAAPAPQNAKPAEPAIAAEEKSPAEPIPKKPAPPPPGPAATGTGRSSPAKGPQEKETTAQRLRKARLALAAAAGKPAAAHPPAHGPEIRTLPRTELLGINDMLTVVSTERETDRRWKMIEANLMMGRPERTYPLIARYPELIGDQASSWPPARLKMVFGNQPGAVLVGVMIGWAVNQVLAVADGNNDPAKIMEWLREREIERLLKLDLSNEIISAEAARKVLKVDRYADETMIKKTWRTLLGFMNADHGRSEERAIHRKKDEIAKYLQIARNVLLKQR